MEESSFTIPADDNGDSELDPRIQVELEKLNAATDEINNLELELDESMKRFHVSLTETSRRLQALSKRLGTCVDRSRPYYEAVATATAARADCQKAAIQFQRASELHAAAKETVTLAEQRFVSKQDEWQFDSNWQEVLNHAIIKVMEAEKRKAESGREHQKKAAAYIAAERKVNQLEDNLKRNIMKSRVYFDEKKICDEELQSQNEKIERLQKMIADAKFRYSTSLRALEEISDDIHRRRGDAPPGEREPGVGAEREPSAAEPSAAEHERGLAALRRRVRELALQPAPDDAWASELNDTIDKLDQLLLMKERGAGAARRPLAEHDVAGRAGAGARRAVAGARVVPAGGGRGPVARRHLHRQRVGARRQPRQPRQPRRRAHGGVRLQRLGAARRPPRRLHGLRQRQQLGAAPRNLGMELSINSEADSELLLTTRQ